MEQATPTIQLSNGSDRPPVIHYLPVRSTRIIQYIVADPSMRRCIIINPARNESTNALDISTEAADRIIEIVVQNSYVVQHIFETNSYGGEYRSAAWYLRTQFAQLQGFAPEISSDSTVSMMGKLWQRRHGADSQLTTHLADTMADGDSFMVGRMRVVCKHVPGLATPHQRALLIGGNLFGAHSLAVLSSDRWRSEASPELIAKRFDHETLYSTWRSVQKILCLPDATRVYREKAPVTTAPIEPFDDVATCNQLNEYVNLNETEFVTRWEGQQCLDEQRGSKPFKVTSRRHKFLGLGRRDQMSIKSR